QPPMSKGDARLDEYAVAVRTTVRDRVPQARERSLVDRARGAIGDHDATDTAHVVSPVLLIRSGTARAASVRDGGEPRRAGRPPSPDAPTRRPRRTSRRGGTGGPACRRGTASPRRTPRHSVPPPSRSPL